MQKTIATTLSVAASVMLIAGTLVPVAYGAAATPTDYCTVRAEITQDEISALAPGDPDVSKTTISAGEVLADKSATDAPKEAHKTSNWGILCGYSVVKQVTGILSLLVGIGAVAVILFAAVLFISAGQSPEKTKAAHGAMLAGIVGLAVAIAAHFLPSIFLSFTGLGH